MPSTVTIDDIELTRRVQSSFEVTCGELTVYIDPHRIGAREVGADKADLILTTYPHFDHLDPEAIDACRKEGTAIVANAVCAMEINDRSGVVAVKEGQAVTQKGIHVKAVPGYKDCHKRSDGFNVGFVFTLGGKNIYHAGDTNKVSEMGQRGLIDVAMVPIGGTYTMDQSEVAQAVCDLIRPVHSIPYGYATGGDPADSRTQVGNAATVHILDPVLNIKTGG